MWMSVFFTVTCVHQAAPLSERAPLLVKIHGGPTGSCVTSPRLDIQYALLLLLSCQLRAPFLFDVCLAKAQFLSIALICAGSGRPEALVCLMLTTVNVCTHNSNMRVLMYPEQVAARDMVVRTETGLMVRSYFLRRSASRMSVLSMCFSLGKWGVVDGEKSMVQS
jgi:hypothetical protein